MTEPPASSTATRTSSSANLGPHFMARISPLPWERLEPLHFADTVKWDDEVLELESALGRAAQTLPDQIAELVGGEEDSRHRRDLINIRRDIFNMRPPRNADAYKGAAQKLPPLLREDVLEWLSISEAHRAVRAKGQAVFTAELSRCRRALQHILAQPSLRAGILLATPSLDEVIPRYLAANPDALSRRLRRAEKSASEYIYRTVCKTSPFSTFTAVGLGEFDSRSSGLLEIEPGVIEPTQIASHPRLNVALLSRVGDALVASDEMLDDLPVSISTGWTTDRRRVRYMRRTRRFGDASAAMTLDTFDENLFYLAHSDIVDDLFALLADGVSLPFREVREALHTARPRERPMGEVWRYLRHLVRLNLLTVPVLTVNIHAKHPVADFAERIGALGMPWAVRLQSDLMSLVALVESYADATVDERRLLLREISVESDELLKRLGVEDPESLRTVLYEDTSLAPGSVRGSLERWEKCVGADLNAIARFLPVFDSLEPHRLMVRGFFDARYKAAGRCDDLVKFMHDFHQDVYDQYLRYTANRRPFIDNEYQDQENWFKMDDVVALDDARRELIAAMKERYEAQSDDSEMVLDDEFIDRIVARLPKASQDIEPRAYFVQVGMIDGVERLVLNRTYSGMSLLFSRFHHCFSEEHRGCLADRLRTHLEEVTPPDAVLAEITGGFDTTNLNLHEVVTPYEIVCPGEVSFRPESEQIPVSDLSVVLDEENDRLILRSNRLGVEVIPVYLGFLMPMTLPETQRLLLTFSRSRIASLDLWSGTDRPLGDAELGGHPRVRFGDVVLVRRVWKTAPSHLPDNLLGSDGADRILAWRRWARKHDLPRYLFATPDSDAADDEEATDGAVRFGKPQFIDLESHFSLAILDDLAKRANQRLVFTEMLPAPEGLVAQDANGGHHVTELTVEINQKGWES